ncbi:LytTR family transcriptional regulator DNA-binding domain-containing protein [bacterium]|nr:LytTR family transcriptional regulator DNA-binding domain-containing protein [bacterium]
MKLRTILSDDEPLALDVLRLLLQAEPDVDIVAECSNGFETVTAILEKKPDVLFLDIRMPDLDGFGVIQTVGVSRMPVTVFVTAFDQYALRAFEAHALDYLLKPFDPSRFRDTLERVRKQVRQQSSVIEQKLESLLQTTDKHPAALERLVIKESGRIYFVKTDEIDWVEASGSYVTLHCGRQKHLLHQTLTRLEEQLDTSKFVRIHRSTIVNIERIKELKPHFNGEYFIFLSNGARLKLSRSYKDRAKRIFGEL